uniref:Uncharacterized protein n=1 Tax=Branchiostoma floridae TaxID=7739 RepID=C3ZNH6_BRAFL|eukprot:XP_002589918.1 hypothetical protein BRAFLDRAFT_123026 [Branchiostoma floridae]
MSPDVSANHMSPAMTSCTAIPAEDDRGLPNCERDERSFRRFPYLGSEGDVCKQYCCGETKMAIMSILVSALCDQGMMGLALILALLELILLIVIMFISCKLLREKDQWAAKQRTTRMAPQPDGMVILTQYPDQKPSNNAYQNPGYSNGAP